MSSSAVDFRGALAPLVETCTSNNRWSKTVASGLGMLAFTSIQMGVSWPIAGICAAATAGLTYLSETCYRETKPKNTIWFGDSNCLTRVLALESLERDSVDVFTKAAGASSLIGPIQGVGYGILGGDIRLIATACIIAPIAEEILFRGVLEEKFEDLIGWSSDHIHLISEENKKLMSRGASALLFGSVHILGSQVEGTWWKGFVFLSTAAIGYEMSLKKDFSGSLVHPICLHAANNVGNVVGLIKGLIQTKIGMAGYSYFTKT